MGVESMTEVERATRSLQGLAVGDALGKAWGFDDEASLVPRRVPRGPWSYTDDTVMALAIVSTLRLHGRIDRDHLALELAERFVREPERGYGAGAYWLLHQLANGRDWREVSTELFRGGSFGNGSAMRVAPLGAWFADDLDRVCHEVRASAEVTHAHPEGQAGAIAVAVAAALVAVGETDAVVRVLSRTPAGRVRDGIERSGQLMAKPAREAAEALGDGREVCCHDTVPFALWCIAKHGGSFEDAMFAALAGTQSPEADRDTMLAIVGGVVALASAPPPEWLDATEPLDTSPPDVSGR